MFRLIVADPPWSYSNSSNNGAAKKHYDTMSMADLRSLPVQSCCEEDAVLLLWATMPLLPGALEVMDAWGFKFKSAFPWVKVNNLVELKPTYGTGFWVRGNAELVLIGARPKAKPPRSEYLGLISERFKHSKKPGHLQEYAESLPGPYLEMFARAPRLGWTCLGNEIDGKDIRDALKEIGDRGLQTLPLFVV